MPLRPITDWCSHHAIFFDETGHPIGKKKINYKEDTFAFERGLYNFKPNETSFFKYKTMWTTKKFYFYRLHNPDPIVLNNVYKPEFDARAYKRIIETDLIKKLNDLANQGLLSFLLKPKVIIIIIVLGLLLYYFSSGGNPQEALNYIRGTN